MIQFSKTVSTLALGLAISGFSSHSAMAQDSGEISKTQIISQSIELTAHNPKSKGKQKSQYRKADILLTTETSGSFDFTGDGISTTLSIIDGEDVRTSGGSDADNQRASFRNVDGLSAEIEVIEFQDGDDLVRRSFVPPTGAGETVSVALGDTGLSVDITSNGDGSFGVVLSGAPDAMAGLCSGSLSSGGLCGNFDGALRIGGQDLDYVSSEVDWRTKVSGQKQLAKVDDQTLIISSEVVGEDGEVKDAASTSSSTSPNCCEELGIVQFRLTGQADGLVAFFEPIDFNSNATLSVNIGSNEFGSELISADDVPAIKANVFFIDEITFIEPDNVVDLEYVMEISFLDEFGNQFAKGRAKISGAEDLENLSCCFFEEPFEGPEPDEWEYNADLNLNDDGETFNLSLGVYGPVVDRAASVIVTLIPGDGGSEADPATYQAESEGSVLLWIIPTFSDAEGFEIMAASQTLSYEFELAVDGEVQQVLKGLSVVNPIIADTPFLSMEDLEERFANKVYRGKGLKYADQFLRRKAGKSAAKS